MSERNRLVNVDSRCASGGVYDLLCRGKIMPQWMLDLIAGWPMIGANLPTFAVILVLISGVVWAAMSWAYGSIIRHQAAERKLLERQKSEVSAVPKSKPTPGGTPSNLIISSGMVLRSPPATSPLLVPGRFYSTAEKERIVDTMNLIQQGFNIAGRKMMWEAEKISSNPGHHDELDKSIERMRVVYAELEKLSGDLERVRNESRSYPVDFAVLLAAKPVYYDEFQRSVYDYSNALSAYRHFLSDAGEHRGTLAKVVDSEKRHLLRAKHFFEKWMDECDEQMRNARRLLEK